MSFYLWVNIFIIGIPLVLSFEKRIFYFKKWPKVFLSIFIVGAFYVGWDTVSTLLRDWSFNPLYVGTVEIFHLPVEELLCFISVPFFYLFIYEIIQHFHKDKEIRINKNVIYIIVTSMMLLSFIFENRGYTSISLTTLAIFLFVGTSLFQQIVFKVNFILYLAACLVPFFIINGILTSIPVVQYNPLAIWGVKIFTIPIEGFLYDFSFLGFLLLTYKVLGKTKF